MSCNESAGSGCWWDICQDPRCGPADTEISVRTGNDAGSNGFRIDGILAATELGHLPYKKGTFEGFVGKRGLEKHSIKKWRDDVADVVARLKAALQPDDVVLGGQC